jgi:hypothetical protein
VDPFFLLRYPQDVLFKSYLTTDIGTLPKITGKIPYNCRKKSRQHVRCPTRNVYTVSRDKIRKVSATSNVLMKNPLPVRRRILLPSL